MKVRSYGALMGALLTIAGVESAEAAECKCIPTPPKQHAAVHPAPRPSARKHDSSESYAQSGYDYRSSSRVTESFVRHATVTAPAPLVMPPLPPEARHDDGFRVAPNDARIRFYRDEKVIFVPTAAYPPPAYYPQPQAYYPPPPPQPYYKGGYEEGSYDQDYFSGGVGYGASADGGGGGYGGGMTAYLYNGQGGSDLPPNGGGVSLPSGYGPGYLNAWKGNGVPTRGGLAISGSK